MNHCIATPTYKATAEPVFPHGFKGRLVRRLMARPLMWLPYGVYARVVRFVKTYKKQAAFVMPRLVPISEGKVLRVWLTQDIDTQDCWRYLPEVIAIQRQYGLRSTSHVLTKGPYTLDMNYLQALREEGFEIGLHGDWHDAAIGYRSRSAMRARLAKAKAVLGSQTFSYRAPALGVSPTLLEVLHELGFTTDSSLTYRCFYNKGSTSAKPFRYGGNGITEVPLALQDVHILGDRVLSTEQIRTLIDVLVNAAAADDGVMVFNAHPIHIARHMETYRMILEHLVSRHVVFVNHSRELVSHVSG